VRGDPRGPAPLAMATADAEQHGNGIQVQGGQVGPFAVQPSYGFLTIWTAFSTARSFPGIPDILVAVIVTTLPV